MGTEGYRVSSAKVEVTTCGDGVKDVHGSRLDGEGLDALLYLLALAFPDIDMWIDKTSEVRLVLTVKEK